MFIKLLCVKTTYFKEPNNNEWIVNEGDVVNALINREGIRFEYEKNHYSLPFRYSDMEDNFISAFDEEAYNNIYKKVTGCRLYLENGTSYELGDVTLKVELR